MVMAGGDRLTFDACADIWPVLGTTVYYTGESGTASRMKLVSNLVLGLNRVALAEGLSYAQAIGVLVERIATPGVGCDECRIECWNSNAVATCTTVAD